jgi:hypothetical protein
MPYRCGQCSVGTGTLSPVIITTGQATRKVLTLFRLRPFYRSHEEQIARILELKGVEDVAFGRSIRDGFKWLQEQLSIFKGERRKEA